MTLDNDSPPGLAPAVEEVVLEIRSHYRLKDRPVRTLEVLRVFLLDEADVVFDALLRGEAVEARRGPRLTIGELGSAMEAQGFVVSVRHVM